MVTRSAGKSASAPAVAKSFVKSADPEDPVTVRLSHCVRWVPSEERATEPFPYVVSAATGCTVALIFGAIVPPATVTAIVCAREAEKPGVGTPVVSRVRTPSSTRYTLATPLTSTSTR